MSQIAQGAAKTVIQAAAPKGSGLTQTKVGEEMMKQ